MPYVWVLTDDDGSVCGVYETLNAAVRDEKARHENPAYPDLCEWGEPLKLEDDYYQISVKYPKRIEGVCCKCESTYSVMRYLIKGE